MDESQLLALAQGLVAKKETAKRQQQALRAIKGHVESGINVAPLLVSVGEIASSRDAPAAIRQEALQVIAAYVSRPQLREQCSTLQFLLELLWSCLLDADDLGACAAVDALVSLAPEDFLQLLTSVGPEVMAKRLCDMRNARVRAVAVEGLGKAIVRCWPSTAIAGRETQRDGVIEALRVILSYALGDGGPQHESFRGAAAAVLDTLLLEYLCIDPPCFAPIALMHAAWGFGMIYATLLVELMHDIEPAIEIYSSGALVGSSCPWLLPAVAQAGPSDPCWQACSAEAAALRGTLLWMLSSAGGRSASRTSLVDGRCSLFDLVRGTTRSSESANGLAQGISEPPTVLRQALQSAATGGPSAGTNTASCLAQCRAVLVVAMVGFACGSSGDVQKSGSSILKAAEDIARIGNLTAGGKSLLQSFLVEALCSLMALWTLMSSPPRVSDLDRCARICAQTLMVGAGILVQQRSLIPSRMIRVMMLADWALVWNATRRNAEPGAKLNLMTLFALSTDATQQPLPPLLICLLCRDFCALLNRISTSSPNGMAAMELAVAFVCLQCPHGLVPAAPTDVGQSGAACWWILKLASTIASTCAKMRASTSAGMMQVFDVLSASLADSRVLASPVIVAMVAAVLHDIGGLQQVGGQCRRSATEALQRYDTAGSSQLKTCVQQIVEALIDGGSASLANGHELASNMTESPLALLQLHMLSDGISGQDEHAPTATPVSGPPLMVYVKTLVFPCESKSSRIELRIDLYNATALTFQNVSIGLSFTAMNKRGDKAEPTWAYANGRKRPCEFNIDSFPCRGSMSVWQEIQVDKFSPLWISILVSYDNTSAEPVAAADAQTPGGSAARADDVWSEDEDERTARLRFACKPYILPLSVFFRPFLGFDSPPGGAYPPLAIYSTCRASREAGASVGFVGGKTVPSRFHGFHRVRDDGCRRVDPRVRGCFAGISCESGALLCLLVREYDAGGTLVLEVRSSHEPLLNSFFEHLPAWLQALYV